MWKILGYLLLAILFLPASCLIYDRNWDLLVTLYLPAIATLAGAYFGAFYGAKFAFEFQSKKEKKEEVSRNLNAVHSTMFNLAQMASTLLDIKAQIIDLAPDPRTRFVEMMPATPYSIDDYRINLEPLFFLLSCDDRDVLCELKREEERYRNALTALNERSKLHLDVIQPKLENYGVRQHVPFNLEHLTEALGERHFVQLKSLSEQMIELVEETSQSLPRLRDRLARAVNKIYPNEEFFKYEHPANGMRDVDEKTRIRKRLN